MATPHELLATLARAYSFSETRLSGDSEYSDAIRDFQTTQGGLGWVVIRVEENGFSARQEQIPAESADLGLFHGALREARIREMRFQEVLESGVLNDFLRRLHPSFEVESAPASSRFRGLEDYFGLSFTRTPEGLSGMAGSIQGLFSTGESVQPEEAESTEEIASLDEPEPSEPWETAGTAWAQTFMNAPFPADGDTGAPDPVLSQDLAAEVQAYLDAGALEREGAESRLRERVRNLMMDRDVAALSGVVQMLAEAEGEPSQVQGAVEMAEEFATSAVASHIVARLGSTRDEGGRLRLIRTISRIGGEGALALTDALGEARDRFERRAYMDAMVALGPQGLEMAQQMVDDPRWYVVRNGVTLLGELGGEGAVSYLTAALANGDSRVRRETVLSLGKVGGTDAEQLLLGMLGDGERDVRSVACRALGVLRSGRAYRPLLRILKDDDPDVQIECLRALGQIGDPGAVPQVEKRALGGFFYRPSREIRMAAFRALAGIGTPRAMKALRKGAKDRDKGVRTVVKTLFQDDRR